MEYIPTPNLLLEALSYLGRRAAGNTTEQLLCRLRNRGVMELDRFRTRLLPFGELMEQMDRQIPIPQDALQRLFGNLEGFPFNTIGSCCPAFLLFYPMVSHFHGSLEPIVEELARLTPERLAGMLAISLDVADETQSQENLSGDEFTSRILALSIPAESKVAILDLYHQPQTVITQSAAYLRPTLRFLEREAAALNRLCADFTLELQQCGLENFLSHTSGLSLQKDLHYAVHPFLFGMDTNLAVTPAGNAPVQVYCGVLRGPLQAMLASAQGPEYEVYNAIKLLADRSRFDILCYLRDRRAYGQELSAKFGLSRNTIHHHMSKLLAARLVTCTVDGNRVYYTVDQESVSALLERQRALLIRDQAP